MSLDLSIIIVNTNNRNLLQGCLASIYASTNRISFEIIVIDNASTDGSVDMINDNYPLVKIIKNITRDGYGYSHNRGISQSNGDYVLIFNEDMIVLSNAIDIMVEKIREDPSIGALGCKLLNGDMSLQNSCHRFPSIRREMFDMLLPSNIVFRNSHFRTQMYDWNHDEEKDVDIITGCCMLIPKKVLEEVGSFDTQFFVYSEEFDLCKRIKNKGYGILFTPHAKIIHLGGQTSKTMSLRMSLVMVESKIKYWRKHHGRSTESVARLLTGLGAMVRLLGWLAYYVRHPAERQKSEQMLSMYVNVLLLVTGIKQERFALWRWRAPAGARVE